MNLIKKNDIIELTAQKLVFGGDSIAKTNGDNFVVFIKDAVPGDKLKVKIVSLNKKFARGEIIEIIEPSIHRIKPFCPLYNACGSCQNQNIEYDFLIGQKTNILKEIFCDIVEKEKIKAVIKSPKTKEYRCKVQFPTRETKNSKRVLMGYFKEKTHDIVNIKFCPAQPPKANELTAFIRENYTLGCYDEKKDKGLLKNVLFRFNSKHDEVLTTFVLNCDKKTFDEKYFEPLNGFFENFMSKFGEIKGSFVNFNPKKTNKILGDETFKIKGYDYITETLEDKSYHIGSTSFFQVNPESAVNIFNIVKDNVKEGSTVLDAYGGVGAIGIWLKEKATKITLVEEDKNAILAAHDNFKINEIKRYEIFEGDAKKHFIDFKKQKKSFDYVILDPPRSGCEKEGLDVISEISKNIIYVSCNPLTLKRDLIFLREKGFKEKFIQGVDLFPHTHHIECVCVLNKEV